MSEQKQIKFKYVFPEDYNPTYANGAAGGISAHGEIIVNFFLERTPLPKDVTNLVNPDGTLGGIINVNPENLDELVIRYVATGIVLNEDSAKAIYTWLGEQIQELQSRKALQSANANESE